MNIFFKLFFAIFLLSACVPISVVVPTATRPAQLEATLKSETSLPTKTPTPSFTSTPTLEPFPTLDDRYYSIPSRFSLVYIKMMNEVNGWGLAETEYGSVFRILRTSDSGKSWMDVSPINRFGTTRTFFLDSETAWISDVKWSQTNTWRSLYFTKNGGMSWEDVSVPPKGIMSLYFIDSSIGWAESGSTLYQTIDGGQAWNKFLTNSSIEDSQFLFRGIDNIWISNYNAKTSGFKYLYVSWDGGKTWEVQNMPFEHEIFSDADLNTVNLPVFFGDQLGYMTARYLRHIEGEKVERLLAVFVTNDGGHSWAQRSSVSQTLYRPDYVEFVSPDTAFTTCDAGLCVTKDGAQTWQVVQLNASQYAFFDDIDSFDIDFVTPSKGWLLAWKKMEFGGGTTLHRTEDGGESWISLPVQLIRGEN